MGVINIIYLVEAIIAAIAVITGVIIFEKKKKEGTVKFVLICFGVYFVMFATTFILEKPQINISNIEKIEVNSKPQQYNAMAKYHFMNISDDVKVISDVDYSKVGEYNVVFEVNTLTGKYQQVEKIRVVDSTPPEIVLEGGEIYDQSYSTEFEEPGYKAIDDYEGDLTEQVVVTKQEIDENNFNIVYEVEDSSKNKAKVVRKVSIVDDVPPVIKLNGSANMTVYLEGEYDEKGATATDEIDGDLTDKIETTGKVDTSKEGTYTITYKVSDNSNNESEEKRKVSVKKKIVASSARGNAGNGDGVIYLTFDDGPSTGITPKILNILKEKNVKATFFILNYNSDGEKLVKREHNEGHTVAIHGYSHDYATIYQSEEAFMNNVTKLRSKINNSIGISPNILRFPGGSSNTISRRYNSGIMTRLTARVLEEGFKYYDWNVSSGDAGGARSSSDVYHNVTSGLSKSKQNVVLMHDFSGNTKTLNALEDIIDYGLEHGYSFGRITESTPMVTHSVNN